MEPSKLFIAFEDCIISYYERLRYFDNVNIYSGQSLDKELIRRAKVPLIFEHIRPNLLVRNTDRLDKCFYNGRIEPYLPADLQPLAFFDNSELFNIICQIPESVEMSLNDPFFISLLSPEQQVYLNLSKIQEILNTFSYFENNILNKKISSMFSSLAQAIHERLSKYDKGESLKVFFNIRAYKKTKTHIQSALDLEKPPLIQFEDIFYDNYKAKIDQFLAILNDVTPEIVNSQGRYINCKPNATAMKLFFLKLRDKGVVNITMNRKTYGVCIAHRFPGLNKSFIDSKSETEASVLYGKEFDDRIEEIKSN